MRDDLRPLEILNDQSYVEELFETDGETERRCLRSAMS